MRICAIWLPDWPAHAVRLEQAELLDYRTPVVVHHQHQVQVTNAAARRAGIRRGMPLRQARSLAPELVASPADPEREARIFDSVLGELQEAVAAVELIRPGLVVMNAAAAERFYGSEEAAGQVLSAAAALPGVDVFLGVADSMPTAFLAARTQTVVPPGEDAAFLAPLPLSLLAAETALGIDTGLLRDCAELGLKTLGQVAQLPARSLITRFGSAGKILHDIASGAPSRGVGSPAPAPEFRVVLRPEEPITRVDEAAFFARQAAAELQKRLQQQGLQSCCLKIQAISLDPATGAEKLIERTWRTQQPLQEAAVAERVRWQLDGWLSRGASGPLVELALLPQELGSLQATALWETGSAAAEAHRAAVERVQSQLGVDSVRQPVFCGGRGPVEVVSEIPFGEAPPPAAAGRWPGQLPSPHPAQRGGGPTHPAARARVWDAAATEVKVTADALLTNAPANIGWGTSRYSVTGWAGPWPVDENWWEPTGRRCARLQLSATDTQGRPRAWLLLWVQGQWRVEASYN